VSKGPAKSARQRKRWSPRSVAAIALLVGVAGAVLAWWLPPTYGCVAVNGASNTLLLNVDRLARGTAQKYCWKLPDRAKTVRFIVARQNDGAINVVLDACRVCYLNNLGYERTRGGLVCRFCGNRYSIDSLKIGRMSCLPFKLPFERDRGLLKIKISDLRANSRFFPPQPFADVVLSSAFGWFVSFAEAHETRVAGRAQGRPYTNNP